MEAGFALLTAPETEPIRVYLSGLFLFAVFAVVVEDLVGNTEKWAAVLGITLGGEARRLQTL